MPLGERETGIMNSHLQNLGKNFLVQFPELNKVNATSEWVSVAFARYVSVFQNELPEMGVWGCGWTNEGNQETQISVIK